MGVLPSENYCICIEDAHLLEEACVLRGRVEAMEAHIRDLEMILNRLLTPQGMIFGTEEEIKGNPLTNIAEGRFIDPEDPDGRVPGTNLTTGIVPHSTQPKEVWGE